MMQGYPLNFLNESKASIIIDFCEMAIQMYTDVHLLDSDDDFHSGCLNVWHCDQ